MTRLAVTFAVLVVVMLFLVVARFQTLEERVRALEESGYVQSP